MFLYFGIQFVDELVELGDVLLEMDKGALGIFFQLNDFIGLFTTFYIAWFVGKFDVVNKDAPENM